MGPELFANNKFNILLPMKSSALGVLILAVLLPSFASAQAVAVSSSAPTLEELGFSQSATQGSDQDQALLDKRSRMLKIHQELGLITIAPLLATLYTAPGDKSHQSARNIHAALGITTFSLFDSTVYFAVAAPKPKGTVDKGPIRWHKRFAIAATVGMLATPILGAMAYDQSSKGEKVHGAASYHGTAAAITALSYAGAILSVSIKF
jgi:hypothetical protein